MGFFVNFCRIVIIVAILAQIVFRQEKRKALYPLRIVISILVKTWPWAQSSTINTEFCMYQGNILRYGDCENLYVCVNKYFNYQTNKKKKKKKKKYSALIHTK